MSTDATAISKPEPTAMQVKQPQTIRDRLQDPALIQQIQRALPEHMSADRMTRVALTALTRTPKLAECTQQSFFRCLLDLSSWGLEPDGRHAHLIPYKNECTLVLDYKGLVKLSLQSGFVRSINADVVRQGDVFTFNLGRVLAHVPHAFRSDPDKPVKAGDIIAAYCVVEMKDGASKHEVMTKDEIDAIRNRSMAKNSGPWVTDYVEMAKKTVYRRASKWLPLSAEIIDAFERDHDKFPPMEKHYAPKIEAIDLAEMMGE